MAEYEPGFTFHKGQIFRGVEIVRGAKFYPKHHDGSPHTALTAINGQKVKRPASDTARHLLVGRIGKKYYVFGAEHQARSLDTTLVPVVQSDMLRQDAFAKHDADVAQYDERANWHAAERF